MTAFHTSPASAELLRDAAAWKRAVWAAELTAGCFTADSDRGIATRGRDGLLKLEIGPRRAVAGNRTFMSLSPHPDPGVRQ